MNSDISNHSPHINSSAPHTNKDKIIIFLLFTLPYGILAEFDLIGKLFLADIITIAVFPFCFIRWRRKNFDSLTQYTFLLLSLWLTAQILTDLIHGTPTDDLMRGWSKIALSLMNFIVFTVLISDKPSHIRALLAGVGGATLLSAILNYAPDNPWLLWKMGGVSGLMILLLSLFSGSTKRHYSIAASILAAGGSLALYYNARSVTLFCFVSAAFLIASIFSRRKLQVNQRGVSLIGLAFLAGVILASIFAVFEFYSFAVQSGWLGQDSLNKFIAQGGKKGPIALLLCGRIEWTASLQAIADNPILGHGSWARGMAYRFAMNRDLLSYGCPASDYFIFESDLIPTHSLLFGAWVEAGIMGAVFWGTVTYIGTQTLIFSFRQKNALAPLLIFIAIQLLWDIYFSPYGASRRLTIPAMLVALLHLVRHYRLSQESRKLTA